MNHYPIWMPSSVSLGVQKSARSSSVLVLQPFTLLMTRARLWLYRIVLSSGTKDLSLTRYESLNHETTCRLPETLEEVAISDLAAETFKECGLVEERSDKGDEISVFYPEKVDDLIGRKLYNGLVITGIYTTIDRPLDYWGQYLTKTTPIAEGEVK